MSGTVPNPITREQVALPYRAALAVHPDYSYWAPHWQTIRDCEIGEIEIKRKGEIYLPKLQSMTQNAQYETYLRRAVFFNMTSRTLNALYGTVFRRPAKVSGLTEKQKDSIRSLTKDGTSLHLMAKTTVKEVLAVGRHGLMVDAPDDGSGSPYVTTYTAENILDWEREEVNGRWQLTRVVLREIYYDRAEAYLPTSYKARYRVLALEDDGEGFVYRQYIYLNDVGTFIPDSDTAPVDIITPEVRGEPLDYIPFIVVGPFSNHPDVEKPPMLDIVTLNLSHYLSYANLEQARFYVGTPIYTVQIANNETVGEFYVGPDVVWQLGPDESASILEFAGHGLRFLENALADKEAQIAAIGGRLMPGTARGAAESDNSLALKERNEQTMLLNISDTVDEGITQILRWWADWGNTPRNKINRILFEVNRDFLLKDVGAREFRAIQQMYEAGIIPMDVVYSYLRSAEVIPEWMDEEEFQTRLNDAKQFPNMVDVLARMKNFPDAASFHEYEMQRKLMNGATSVAPGPGDPDMPAVPQQAMSARRLEQQNEADANQ